MSLRCEVLVVVLSKIEIIVTGHVILIIYSWELLQRNAC